ncbi:MAG: hypothetical protein HFI85_00495 [Clostridia bacterium]|jgi:hypothetical protein|nr:hypothetical protein [Clostridia bacterium]
MKDYKNCKKFIAIIGNGYDAGTSDFYIADIDTWNDEYYIPDHAVYNEEVYHQIEKLGFNCDLGAENYFIVEKEINTVEDLAEFLKPLPWIMAIEDREKYIDPDLIEEFVEKEEVVLDIVKAFEGKLIIDDVLESFKKERKGLENRDYFVSISNYFSNYCDTHGLPCKYFAPFKDQFDECKKFLKENKDKVIYCDISDKRRVTLHAFNDEDTYNYLKENCPSYQKLLKIFNKPALEKKTPKPDEKSANDFIKEAKLYPKSLMIDRTFDQAVKHNISKNLIMSTLVEFTYGNSKFDIKQNPSGDLINKLIKEGKFVYCLQKGDAINLLLSFNRKADLDQMLANSKAYQEIRAQLKKCCKDIDDENDIDDEDEKF